MSATIGDIKSICPVRTKGNRCSSGCRIDFHEIYISIRLATFWTIDIQSQNLYVIIFTTIGICPNRRGITCHLAIVRTGIIKCATVLCIGCTRSTFDCVSVFFAAFVPLVCRRTVITCRSNRQRDVLAGEIMVRTTNHRTRRSRRSGIQRNDNITVNFIRRNCQCTRTPSIVCSGSSRIAVYGYCRRRHRIAGNRSKLCRIFTTTCRFCATGLCHIRQRVGDGYSRSSKRTAISKCCPGTLVRTAFSTRPCVECCSGILICNSYTLTGRCVWCRSAGRRCRTTCVYIELVVICIGCISYRQGRTLCRHARFCQCCRSGRSHVRSRNRYCPRVTPTTATSRTIWTDVIRTRSSYIFRCTAFGLICSAFRRLPIPGIVSFRRTTCCQS